MIEGLKYHWDRNNVMIDNYGLNSDKSFEERSKETFYLRNHDRVVDAIEQVCEMMCDFHRATKLQDRNHVDFFINNLGWNLKVTHGVRDDYSNYTEKQFVTLIYAAQSNMRGQNDYNNKPRIFCLIGNDLSSGDYLMSYGETLYFAQVIMNRSLLGNYLTNIEYDHIDNYMSKPIGWDKSDRAMTITNIGYSKFKKIEKINQILNLR